MMMPPLAELFAATCRRRHTPYAITMILRCCHCFADAAAALPAMRHVSPLAMPAMRHATLLPDAD